MVSSELQDGRKSQVTEKLTVTSRHQTSYGQDSRCLWSSRGLCYFHRPLRTWLHPHGSLQERGNLRFCTDLLRGWLNGIADSSAGLHCRHQLLSQPGFILQSTGQPLSSHGLDRSADSVSHSGNDNLAMGLRHVGAHPARCLSPLGLESVPQPPKSRTTRDPQAQAPS